MMIGIATRDEEDTWRSFIAENKMIWRQDPHDQAPGALLQITMRLQQRQRSITEAFAHPFVVQDHATQACEHDHVQCRT